MRFEFYTEALADQPKLSVDGLVENSIHFSHWSGNQTNALIKADTSTGIALNVVESRKLDELTQGIELITNNHFDTDGLLSVWVMLTGTPALEIKNELIAAAEAGDFSEFPSTNAVRASIVIQGSDYSVPEEGVSSPLAFSLNGGKAVDKARAYELLLPKVADIITNVAHYEALWREDWDRIEAALNSFEMGSSRVTEYNESGLSLIRMDSTIYSDSEFKPTRHLAPYTAVAQNAKGRFFLIAAESKAGWSYRADYPYYSWAETVVRPRIPRYDFTDLIGSLNRLELEKAKARISAGTWIADGAGLTSAVKFDSGNGATSGSCLDPFIVAGLFNEELIRHSK